MTTSDKNFKVKNGLVVQGTTATVNGFDVLTKDSLLEDLSNIDDSEKTEGSVLIYNDNLNIWKASQIEGAIINIDGGLPSSTFGGISSLNAGGV
jgi:hypothetical protein